MAYERLKPTLILILLWRTQKHVGGGPDFVLWPTGRHFIVHPTFLNRAVIFSWFTVAYDAICLLNAFAFRLPATLGHHAVRCSDVVQCSA